MAVYDITKAGATRHCNFCDRKILKGEKFLIEEWSDGYYKYNNHCSKCGIKELKRVIKHLIGCLNTLHKLENWDK